MAPTRRDFLEQALVVSAGIAAAGSVASASSADDVMAVMKWLNEPVSFKRDGSRLIVMSRPKTDFWRKTFYGYVTDNGHFLSRPAPAEFTFQVRVNGKYAAQYDQAGIMVRADEKNWMKCGSELVDGKRQASVVFTREFSDWSTLPDFSQSEPVWWRVVRKKDSLETMASVGGKKFTTVRQGYFPPEAKANVGIMCAAPEGPGFEAVFDEFMLT